jgi:putative FmdB family regulatory protein
MPLYEFRCPECGARFEELVFSSGGDKVVCPDCGNQEPVREMSTFASRGDSSSFASSAGSSCGGHGGFS